MSAGLKPQKCRTVVISGGAAGIGRAVALLCAQAGDCIIVLDRDQAGAEETASLSLANGATEALAYPCDVSDEVQVEHAFAEIQQKFTAPTGVFANAGIDRGGLIHELPVSTWRQMFETNVTGVFLVCKHALLLMLKAKVAGSIVCTSSPASFVAFASGACATYSATKGAISAFVRCLAVDYAPFGIRVNAVVPGATETALMWSNVPKAEVPNVRERLHREIPIGRIADPQDAARAVLWLLSDDSSYVTGSHLVCDGGVLAKGSISV